MGKDMDYYALEDIFYHAARNQRQSPFDKALQSVAQVLVETKQKDYCRLTPESLLSRVDLSSLSDNDKQNISEIAQAIALLSEVDKRDLARSAYYYYRVYHLDKQKDMIEPT